MNMGETLRSALRSLRSNRLRSMLTAVGIIIGVAAVIVLVRWATGMKAGFDAQFSQLATISPSPRRPARCRRRHCPTAHRPGRQGAGEYVAGAGHPVGHSEHDRQRGAHRTPNPGTASLVGATENYWTYAPKHRGGRLVHEAQEQGNQR